MSELKTFKELGNQCGCGHCGECSFKEELKQEAIKWIKEFDKGIYIDHEGKEFGDYDYEPMMTSRWIKHFFNITDEDLRKEGEE